jgi:hypothetical protein
MMVGGDTCFSNKEFTAANESFISLDPNVEV